jgi:hypothetical protein
MAIKVYIYSPALPDHRATEHRALPPVVAVNKNRWPGQLGALDSWACLEALAGGWRFGAFLANDLGLEILRVERSCMVSSRS